jgi:hypothetical protein
MDGCENQTAGRRGRDPTLGLQGPPDRRDPREGIETIGCALRALTALIELASEGHRRLVP